MNVRYSKADIADWKSKLKSLPQEIEALEKSVADNLRSVSTDEKQLRELIDTRIKPEKLLLKQIIAKIDLLTLPEQIPPLKAQLPPLELQIEDLRQPIIQAEAIIEPIKKEIRKIKLWMEIKEIQKYIHELGTENSFLDSYRSKSKDNLIQAEIERNEVSRLYDEIHHEVQNLKAQREKLNEDIKQLKRERAELEATARKYSTTGGYTSSSASGGYSSTAVSGGYSSSAASGGYSSSSSEAPSTNQGYTSSSRNINPSGYGSSVNSNVLASLDTNLLIAEHNAKIKVIEAELNDLDRHLRKQSSYCSEISARNDAALKKVISIELQIKQYTLEIQDVESRELSLTRKLMDYDSEDKVYAQSHQFEFFRENLTQQENNLSPIEKNLYSLRSQKDALLSKHRSLSDHISQLEKRIEKCVEITKTFSSTENLEQLIQRRADQEVLLKQLDTQRQDLENGIVQRKNEIKINKDTIDNLNIELRKKRSNSYLNDLENHPVDLLNQLAANIYEAIQLFDVEHLYHQSVTVRKCLAELNNKLNYILPQQDLPLPNDIDPVSARNKYYLICGLLQVELAKLDMESDREMRELIKLLLREHIISLEEARADYNDYVSEHSADLPSMTNAHLLQSEKQTFENMRSDFQASIEKYKLSPSPELLKVSKLGSDLLDRIDHKRKKSQETGEAFDHKYYSSLIGYGNKLLTTKPDDQKYAGYKQNFKKVARQHPDDRHSPWNKVGGIALMFLGAVIVAAGVLSAILSYPFAPPLSYYMGGTVCALGLVHIVGGITLFQRGSRPGTPEKLSDFSSSIEKAENQLTEVKDTAEDSFPKAGSYGLKSA